MTATEEVIRCPICSAVQLKTLYICKDHTNTGELFPVKQCIACQFTLTSPRPSEVQAGKYYQSAAYISHQTDAETLFDRIYLTVRLLSMQWKYNLVKPYLHGSLLDYGCGTGSFIKYCNKKGISVTGVEPSDARNSITDIPVYKALDNLNEQQFSVITLWHVLEHVYQLREILQILKEKLTQNGTIFIAVPNRESLDAKTYREFWAAWDVPRHIWHFSPDNMKALISQEGMQIREIIPMKLDAYYVSLLSEKYKRGGKHTVRGLIGALKTAIQSNFTASKNGQYSSLIYRISR